ncbi:MAG: hypothetical protein CMD92_07200 [Gammaproteobacteria bacterium]|nr:hypothetical protein [Gammaproteobacteria bacterium]|tara:strand:+ start:591 stop:2432 length:1842 start_codon:yes stop_codon:yes gene_type:complete
MEQSAQVEEDEPESDEQPLSPEPSLPSSSNDDDTDEENQEAKSASGLPWKTFEDINRIRWQQEHKTRMSKWVGVTDVSIKQHSDALARDLYKEMQEERRRRRRHNRRERGDHGSMNDRITERECDNVDEAACYNYVENELTNTQVRFVQEHLKNAHESFVAHYSNRHNYGKIALMDLSEDAYVEPEVQAAPTAMTRTKHKETKQMLETLKSWTDPTGPTGLNEEILNAWNQHKSKDKWYASQKPGVKQGAGNRAEPQAISVQAQLILETFKSYKSVAAWWDAYKGKIKYPNGKYWPKDSNEYRLREGLLNWLLEGEIVTYEAPSRQAYMCVVQYLWEFLDVVSEYLSDNKINYEAEKDVWGTYQNANVSERLLSKLTGTQTAEQQSALNTKTRVKLRAKVEDTEALIAKDEDAAKPRSRRNAKAITEEALGEAKKVLQNARADPTKEAQQWRELHLKFFAALKDFAGDTSQKLLNHIDTQKIYAIALIGEMEDIGYQNNANTPEYVVLVQALRDVLDLTRQLAIAPPDDTAYTRVWKLHRAYDHAFAAVYGDSSEVIAFKTKFEERAFQRARADKDSATEEVDHEEDAAFARVVQRRREELNADVGAIHSEAF